MNSLEEEALKRLSRIKGNANTSENFNTSETVQDVAEEILKEAEIKGKQLLNEVDLTQLAPKKVTWDLERDIQSRMKILEKETMNVIRDYVRDKIKQQKGMPLMVDEDISTSSSENELDD
ncbi:hypothetical protein ROZALSC1DRAFT_21744 [Rozella allomycis CSF55]|uniref:Uncharacterized protein n=1 Tax=Rozella allomycis (strain CSF55) TaxID=988480 RepID=A0A4P9YKB0_ROZAC|nr:hypothetical protein ROZALSC1DRAFT_21744 [Rozella allomycis CSF55]